MSDQPQQQSRIKELINRGREQGYLTYDEVNDHLPDEFSQCACTCVKWAPLNYLRAKAKSPSPSVSKKAFANLCTHSPTGQIPCKDEEEEEDDNPGGIDPEYAKERFDALRKALLSTEATLEKHGRNHKTSGKSMEALGEVFKFFKLPPRQFDPLYYYVRGVLDRIRVEERLIMRLCVTRSGMPRKTFMKEFPGNELKKSTDACRLVKHVHVVRKKKWSKPTFDWLSRSQRNTPTAACSSLTSFKKATSA